MSPPLLFTGLVMMNSVKFLVNYCGSRVGWNSSLFKQVRHLAISQHTHKQNYITENVKD